MLLSFVCVLCFCGTLLFVSFIFVVCLFLLNLFVSLYLCCLFLLIFAICFLHSGSALLILRSFPLPGVRFFLFFLFLLFIFQLSEGEFLEDLIAQPEDAEEEERNEDREAMNMKLQRDLGEREEEVYERLIGSK